MLNIEDLHELADAIREVIDLHEQLPNVSVDDLHEQAQAMREVIDLNEQLPE